MTASRSSGSRFALALAAALVPAADVAVGQDRSASSVDFVREIQPLLAKRCFSCHGPDTGEGGLRLNKRESALAELDSGEHAIVPGQPEASALIARVSEEDESVRMPPEGKPLQPGEIELLRRWISDGAQWQSHWAFQPVQAHIPPAVKDPSWVRTPIDAFILAKLEQRGLKPAPPAGKIPLLRRITYDLTGLPPAGEEIAAFLADDSEQAYERVVDRLLASPHYGERWGRHWLDLVRYAESNSFERDGAKPNAWRYRDYVVRSLNGDKPYDQFVREQLAGDELDSVTPETIIATGYYRLGIWDDEPADPLQARYDEFDDIIRTTSEVYLGLTVGCARCHDHKIDPIPQKDYYRLLAFFRDLTPYGTRGDQATYSQWDISPAEVRAEYARIEGVVSGLRERMSAIEQRGILRMPGEDQRKTEGRERARVLRNKLRQYLDDSDWSQYAALKAEREQFEDQLRRLPPRDVALAVAKCDPTPDPTHVLLRGSPHAEGDEVEPGYPELFGTALPEILAATDDQHSAGRRRRLADWIASGDNRLTSRVIANRLWQHHFGRGIVRSTNNFGMLGDLPTHPELLDWLATELVRGGWRLKPLHKIIVMSGAYRMSSEASADGLARDPANDLFWRFDMRRLSAEELRDSIHFVTGRFNPRLYGPWFYPALSEEVLSGQSMPGSGWGKSPEADQGRRAIYAHVKRSLITPLLSAFDFPETDATCEARFATTQPGQALGLLNSEFIQEQAAALAARLRSEAGPDAPQQARHALRLALGREPDADEVARGVELIDELQERHQVSRDKALDYFCLVVLNLNEFVYLD